MGLQGLECVGRGPESGWRVRNTVNNGRHAAQQQDNVLRAWILMRVDFSSPTCLV